jgi:hypothetical protein
VIIPDGVFEIGRGAFEGNFLKEVSISNSVKIIGERAFENNWGVSEESLDQNIIHYLNDYSLKKIRLGSNVEIYPTAFPFKFSEFYNNKKLEGIYIWNDTEWIYKSDKTDEL